MVLHRLLVAAGSAVVAFGVVAVAIIELLGAQADVGAGIVGVGLGAFAGVLAFVAVALVVEALAGPARWAVDAVGALGLTLVFVGAFVYVDVVSLETTAVLGVGALAAVVAFAAGWLNGRGRDDRPTA